MNKSQERIFQAENYRGWNVFAHIKQFCTDLKFCRQRITRGFCDSDVWSIDMWFESIIPAMLLDLRDNGKGVPDHMIEVNDDGEDEDFAKSREKWEAVLTEMANRFLALKAIEDMPFEDRLHYPIEEYNKAKKEAFELFSEHFRYLWW